MKVIAQVEMHDVEKKTFIQNYIFIHPAWEGSSISEIIKLDRLVIVSMATINNHHSKGKFE